MSSEELSGAPPGRALGDSDLPICSFGNCSKEAKWRQFSPTCRRYPLYLCTSHWLHVRMERPELLVAYGWISAFPPAERGDPYEPQAERAPDRAAYEIEAPETPSWKSEVVGEERPLAARDRLLGGE